MTLLVSRRRKKNRRMAFGTLFLKWKIINHAQNKYILITNLKVRRQHKFSHRATTMDLKMFSPATTRKKIISPKMKLKKNKT